jgi:hypothetical protein
MAEYNPRDPTTWQNASTFDAKVPRLVELWSPLAMVKWVAGERVGEPPVLHQLWASLTTGKQEWREVPTEPATARDARGNGHV